ncbi:branched-subunit amino acid ABC-type transport system permease component [Bradyrhizobium sp. AZCC 2262]|uniref:branched-chain amino acid ABC transporter permease n=1 Tax=Bradyrhizobium sp. AZCC 2262 TaxID=3117022 RepID=UPI002FF11401
MDFVILVGIDFVNGIATLALMSIGLAVVFGMMRIINLAHGEFMVMGSYSAAVATHFHVNIWIAILIVPPITVAIIGLLVERVIMRHLYGRMVETMLATWGLSLFIVGCLTMVFGDHTEGVPAPLPAIKVGDYQASGYGLFVIFMSTVTIAGVYAVLRTTRLGLLARGTMQNAEMAAALGVDTSRIYATTFAFGAGLAGLAGGVLAPISGVFPSIGGSYIGRAFITVIGGGPAPLVGTISASAVFGFVNQLATFVSNPVYGEVALLIGAVILIRLLPNGITGRYFRRAL